MTYIYLFIFVLGLVIVLIDIIPQLKTWQSRIHIGHFQNKELWQEKVFTLSKKWLKNTPTIPLTDNTRLVVIDILRSNCKRSAIQSWQEAALVLGLTEYYRKTGDAEIQTAIQSFITTKMTAAGAWKEKPTDSDHAILAYAFLSAEFIDHQKYKSAFDETYNMILSLKGEDGAVAYKNHVRQFRFVDTIGFICPFLVTYGLKYNTPEAVDLALKQITEFEKCGMMPGEMIPCHTYLVSSKIPAGLFGWGRGLGWFAIGLVDSWNALPSEHMYKNTLEEVIIKTARSALKFQRNSGGFNWLLFVKEARLDSSTTAALSWFFTFAAEIPVIAAECISARNAGLKYLRSVTRRNGAVDFSQGDTKTIGVYSQNFNILPFTQGFVLRALNCQPPAHP